MWKHAAFVQARKATLVTTDKDFEHVRAVLKIPWDWEYGDPREMGEFASRAPRRKRDGCAARAVLFYFLHSFIYILYPCITRENGHPNLDYLFCVFRMRRN